MMNAKEAAILAERNRLAFRESQTEMLNKAIDSALFNAISKGFSEFSVKFDDSEITFVDFSRFESEIESLGYDLSIKRSDSQTTIWIYF